MTPESLRIIATNLVLLTFTTLNELGNHPAELFEDFSPLTDVNRAESLDELEEFFISFFDKIKVYAKDFLLMKFDGNY